MSIEQWFEKATVYFSSEMTPEEAALFEAETAANEELSELMQLWKTTDEEAIIYEQSEKDATNFITTHQKLKQDFVKTETSYELPVRENKAIRKKLKISLWQWVAVAAILMGIVVGIDLLIPSGNKIPVVRVTSPQKNADTMKDPAAVGANKDTGDDIKTLKQKQGAILYAQAFVPDKIPEDSGGPLDDALFYYASAQYENAIAAIDNAHAKTATRGNNAFTPLNDFYASYYKALSLMSLENTTAAIPLLQQALQQSPAKILSIKTRWYLSLAYLKEERIYPATETLQLIIKDPAAGDYKNKAEKLSEAIIKRQ